MDHFFLVADWGAKHYLIVPEVLLSAGTVYHPKKKGWDLSRTNLPDVVEQVFIDSGGYSFLTGWGKYPFDLEEYLSLCYHVRDKHNLFAVATLDFPCLADPQNGTNQENIENTVKNAFLCMDSDKTLPWVPVIQGYSIKEYQTCMDLYKDAGVKSNYWAVGSLTQRKRDPITLRRIITYIKDQHKTDNIHSFGLGIPNLKDPQIFKAIYSSDSSGWNFWISGENSRELKKESAIHYWFQIEDMIEAAEGQTTL